MPNSGLIYGLIVLYVFAARWLWNAKGDKAYNLAAVEAFLEAFQVAFGLGRSTGGALG